MSQNELPDIDTRAASQSPPAQDELVKLLRLVVGLVVRSEDNKEHVNAMQSLPYDDQVTMMSIVESLLADPAQTPSQEGAQDAKVCVRTGAADIPEEMEKEIQALRCDFERATERCQIQHERLVTMEAELQRVQEEHQQLDQLVESLREVERERDALRDKHDEWRHMAELTKKQERQLDVLRDRVGETAELRRQVRELESKNTELTNAVNSAANRSAMDLTDKNWSERRAMERKYAELLEAHETVCRDRDKLECRCCKLEEQRRTDQEQLSTLFARIRSLELDESLHMLSLVPETREPPAAEPVRKAALEAELKQLQNEQDRLPSSDNENHSHAVIAPIFSDTKLMRDQARLKEAETRKLLSQLEKKMDEEDVVLLADIITESFAQQDLLYQRLQATSEELDKVRGRS